METLEQYLYKKHTNKTAATYLYYINVFSMQHPDAEKYTYKDMVNYMDLQKKRGVEISKLNTQLAAIKRYYSYLVETGQRNDHPCMSIRLKRKKKDIQLQDLFTSSELELLMNRENRFKNLELRNKVIVSFLIHQGLTSNELCRLTVEDIDLDEASVYVKGSKTCTARTLDLKPSQIRLIQSYVETSRKALFKSTTKNLIITQRGVSETVDGIHSMIEPLKSLFPDRNLNPTTIRQSVISNLLNVKKMPLEDVQLFAGHKWTSTTEKYKRNDISEQRALINKWHPLG